MNSSPPHAQRQTNRMLFEAVVLVLVGSILGFCHYVWRPPFSPNEMASLRGTVQIRSDDVKVAEPIESHRADFGTVHINKRIVRTFEYTNRSGQVQVLEAGGSRGQTNVSIRGTVTLSPDEKVVVVAEVAAPIPGRFEDDIMLFAKGLQSPVAQFKLVGRFEKLIEIQPPIEGVSFGVIMSGKQISRNILLAELKHHAIKEHSWSCSPKWLVVDEQPPVTRDDGTRVFDVRLIAPSSAPRGDFQGHVVLNLDSDRFDTISIPVAGTVQ